MSYRHVEYFAAGSWERLSEIINRWMIDHNCNLVNIVPLYRSPEIHTIIWHEAYVIVEEREGNNV